MEQKKGNIYKILKPIGYDPSIKKKIRGGYEQQNF
jgi:hypothetical protein